MFLKKFSFVGFDDDPNAGDPNAGDPNAGDPNAGDPNAGDPNKVAKYSQDDLNRINAKEKRKYQEASRRQADQLKQLQQSTALSTEEKEALQGQIDELQTRYMTAEQQKKLALKKAREEHEAAVTNLTKDRDTWKGRYERNAVDVDIASAVREHKAHDFEQVAALLRPNTRLADVLDEEGKSTGETQPRVTFQDVDKDDNPVTLDLTVTEAVKKMREQPRHANLFEGVKAGGLGATGTKGLRGGKVDMAKLAKENVGEYRRQRQADRKAGA